MIRLIEHPSTGVTGRRAEVGYIFRVQDRCGLGSAELRQEHVQLGRFGQSILVDLDGNANGNFKQGDPIECSVADQVRMCPTGGLHAGTVGSHTAGSGRL